MAQLIAWAEAALDDIDGNAEFIARDSATQARRVVAALFALGDTIAQAPRIGRMVPELQLENVRERCCTATG